MQLVSAAFQYISSPTHQTVTAITFGHGMHAAVRLTGVSLKNPSTTVRRSVQRNRTGGATHMSARSRTKNLPAVQNEDPSTAAKVLSQIIERGARVQGPAVKAYVDRLREHYPTATPAEIVSKLKKQYLAAVMASGAAVGSAAAFPGIGTLVAHVGRRRRDGGVPRGDGRVRARGRRGPRDPRRAPRAPPRTGAGGARRRGQQARRRRTPRARPHQRRVDVRRRGDAAVAGGVAAEQRGC